MSSTVAVSCGYSAKDPIIPEGLIRTGTDDSQKPSEHKWSGGHIAGTTPVSRPLPQLLCSNGCCCCCSSSDDDEAGGDDDDGVTTKKMA